MTKKLRFALTLCVLSVPAFAAAGCGSGSASGSDTAALAPPSSFIYAEATIDPAGSQEAGMRSILGDLPGSGPPQQRLDDLLEQASRYDTSSKVHYLKDVKPWLGDKASLFVANAAKAGGGSTTAWALVIATTDEGAANDTIDKGTGSNTDKKSYRGVEYVIDRSEDDTAQAVVDGFVVVGSEAGMKAAIDATKGDSLSESDRYKEAVKDAPSERIALAYEDLSGILQAVSGATGNSLGPAAPLLGRLLGDKPVVATIRAEHQALVVDGSLVPSPALSGLLGKSTPLLGEVPADSWLALGQPDFGAEIKKLVGLFAGMVGGEQALSDQLRAATGLDLDQDLLSWIGDVAFFVHGDAKTAIGGGALIQTKDSARSQAALTKIAAAIAKQDGGPTVASARIAGATGYQVRDASMPKPVYLIQSGDKVALAYGEEAAKAAIVGGDRLDGSADFKRAAGELGDAFEPSLYVSVPPILRLAESFGAGGGDYAKAKPYLTILDYLVAGTAKGSSRTRIGFKPHE